MFSARRIAIPGLPPLDFDVAPGRVLGIAGPSGSGKTRLLRALADLDPVEGVVRLDGEPAAEVPGPEWRRRVGLLPAEPRFWRATVGEHFPDLAKDGAADADPGTEEPDAGTGRGEWLGALGLDPAVMDADPAKLSTGQRARLALLRLLARSPAVLLLDEPTANLDAGNRARAADLIARYRTGRGAPVIWASHSESELDAADQVLHLPDGTLSDGFGTASAAVSDVPGPAEGGSSPGGGTC